MRGSFRRLRLGVVLLGAVLDRCDFGTGELITSSSWQKVRISGASVEPRQEKSSVNPFNLFRSGGGGIVAFYAMLCCVVFLLQWFPATGIVLMFLLAPFWIGALVHIMMAHLTLMAMARSIAPVWLGLPLAYYLGGAALHWQSVQAAQALAAQIENANAKQSLPVQQPFSYRSDRFETLALLEMYRVASAFSNGGKANGQQEYVKYYYAKDTQCELASRGYSYEKRSEPFRFRPDLFYYVHGNKTRQCLLQQSVTEKPDLTYEINSWLDRDLPATFLLRAYVIAWQARDLRTDTSVTVRVGSIVTLPWIQTIAAGCALDDGKPAWECFGSLINSSNEISVGVKKRTDHGNPFTPIRDPDTWQVTALARALGLSPRDPND
jgi:hypothetical protein